ncbi:quinoprotein dehydrogenase-associated SoxYZ-like carrier [Hyphomicrobium sp.]|uniref:quinoprotein dehydrogenase-associated SoxYZ-like carrier n=1 Tax=Hyphomicrobium sp. TaxID=82 RepID=UPI0025BDE49C|nr:quinoprotein dehydrogenase-associated SoxYZ-like carrier [Hyphomicrobium sp.]MCC7252833.1 quinoprotein dehydrogenase-associated SoxYZ-like carrier [Hyphomicrobium sp.]
MSHHRLSRRSLLVALGLAACAAPGASVLAADEDLWPGLKEEVFGERAIAEDDGAVTLYAPERAEDAALVPLSIRIPGNVAPHAVALTLIIDRNPAPVAATFSFGEAFRAGPDIGERQLATRIRLDSFSKVRAILETADGRLHMSSRFVSGAGGCSATPSKDIEQALAGLGKIDIKAMSEPARGESFREAQVMIRHPNFTGLQMDPDTRGYVPARFVDDLEVKSAGRLLFRMQGGISISENPHFRVSYSSLAKEAVEVNAKDTEGLRFSERSEPSGS